MAIDLSDEFLADVIIPSHPCPPARCTTDEWLAEAATLPYLAESFGSVLIERASQLKAAAHGRYGDHEAVVLAIQTEGSLDGAAEALCCTREEIAGALVKSQSWVPAFLETEEMLREFPHASYSAIADACDHDKDYQFVARTARTLGLERDYNAEPERVAFIDSLRELRDEGLTMRQIGERVGMHHSRVCRLLKPKAAAA